MKGEKMLKAFLKDETGATAIEYGLIAALISIGVIAGASTVGEMVSNQHGGIADTIGKVDLASGAKSP